MRRRAHLNAPKQTAPSAPIIQATEMLEVNYPNRDQDLCLPAFVAAPVV